MIGYAHGLAGMGQEGLCLKLPLSTFTCRLWQDGRIFQCLRMGEIQVSIETHRFKSYNYWSHSKPDIRNQLDTSCNDNKSDLNTLGSMTIPPPAGTSFHPPPRTAAPPNRVIGIPPSQLHSSHSHTVILLTRPRHSNVRSPV